MAANHDAAGGAVEDLEAMLDRSLQIQASPPRWQPNYRIGPDQHPHYAQPATPVQDVSPNVRYGGNIDSPTRKFPQRVPVNTRSSPAHHYNSPQAVYQSPHHSSTVVAAAPTNAPPLGMRQSSSQHSIASHQYYQTTSPQAQNQSQNLNQSQNQSQNQQHMSLDPWEQRQQQAAAEVRRQQQIIRQQQAEQQRLELQRRERLMKLQEQQDQQERELEALRQRDAQVRRQIHQYQYGGDQYDQYGNPLGGQLGGEQQRLEEEHELLEQRRVNLLKQQQQERYEQQHLEHQRLERQKLEHQRLEQQRFEQQRLEQQRLEHERLEQQQLEQQQQQLEEEEANARQREELEREEEESRKQQAWQHQQQLAAERAREQKLEREGAATMVQKTQDSNGNVTTRVVKKGVEDFEFKEELGAGSYSTVVAAQDKQTLRQYAIKVLDKAHIIKEQKVKYVEIEKHTLNRLGDHPGIIRLFFTFQDRQSLYFVLDFAPNGELLHLIKRIGSLNEACARYYASQLLDAIEYMHEKGVVHRDLKPENILLDYKMRIKITDFGTAKLLEEDPKTGKFPSDVRANSFVGTAEYVSPELLVGKSQGKSADIWAWGCVLYQMIAAVPPFQGNTQYLTFQKIARLQYSIPPGFPFVVRDLLRHVLVKPQQRWTPEEIKQHEFFEGQDWSRKNLWSSPPPRLLPYKASVASMKPRALKPTPQHQHQHHQHHQQHLRPTKPVGRAVAPAAAAATTAPVRKPAPPSQPQQQQQFVPTSAGLQAVNPSTLYGMPVNIHRTDAPASKPPAQASRSATKRTNQSANAASAALYKTPLPTSSAYQQSQERIQALKRRMQEQRQAAAGSRAPISRPTTPGSPTVESPDSPSLNTQTVSPSPPASPQLPLLAQPPLTQLESQYSNLLVSAQERILKIGRMSLLVSTHLPPQAGHHHHHHHKHNARGEESQSQAQQSQSQSQSQSQQRGGSGSDDEEFALSYEEDSLFSKMFLSKNKSRTTLVTTCGRLLVLADERKILYEVPLGVPQTEVSEMPFLIGDQRTMRIVVQTYNKVLTLDDPGHNQEWLHAIELSKRYYAQLVADQERNSFNAAAAAASAVAGRRR